MRIARSAFTGLLVGAFALGPVPAGRAAATTPLVGLFRITAGTCTSSGVTGSYFRMILSGGNASGPYMSNSDSPCSDQTYTPMSPGRDGGLSTSGFQPEPSPAFDGSGNSLADGIVAPQKFYGVAYSASTNRVDPQTGVSVPPPTIAVSNGRLSGDVAAVAVSWNNQQFNQGSPKPNGSYPGNTTALTGHYDASTGRYTLTWLSQVEGGPFNGFTGSWTLTGTFVPSGHAPATQPASNGALPHTSGSYATPAPAATTPTGGARRGATARGRSSTAGVPTLAGSGAASPSSSGDPTTTAAGAANQESDHGGGSATPVIVAIVLAAGLLVALARTVRRRAHR